jgi:hypothetical protein
MERIDFWRLQYPTPISLPKKIMSDGRIRVAESRIGCCRSVLRSERSVREHLSGIVHNLVDIDGRAVDPARFELIDKLEWDNPLLSDGRPKTIFVDHA